MNSNILILLVLQVLSVQNNQFRKQVDASKDALSLPLGNWFNSIEVLNHQNSDEIKARDVSVPNDDQIQEVVVKRKKIRRKKKKLNKSMSRKSHINNSTVMENGRRKKPKRSSKKKTVVDNDRDFNVSESFEGSGRRKPVDIIVHIKMNE